MTADRENNFGFLRLFFAISVIFSHSSELIDGNRSREIISRIFGALTLGQIAVDGFFLISGYLITKSAFETKSSKRYLLKRFLRIYPAFIAAYLICLFVIGPLVGGHINQVSPLTAIFHFLTLQPPEMPGAFVGLPKPQLDGPMWTLAYEFRCYILAILLVLVGGGKKTFTLIAIILLVGMCVPLRFKMPSYSLFGDTPDDARLMGAFFTGSMYYLWKDKIVYRGDYALIAAVTLIPSLFIPALTQFALVIFGGYILFWFAFNINNTALRRVGADTDISYGIYLWGWPVQNIIILKWPYISPGMLFPLATLVAGLAALGSWFWVERPFLRLKTRR